MRPATRPDENVKLTEIELQALRLESLINGERIRDLQLELEAQKLKFQDMRQLCNIYKARSEAYRDALELLGKKATLVEQ